MDAHLDAASSENYKQVSMIISSDAPRLPQMHGIVVLNKPSGPTSTQCLSVLKQQGQRKIGHAGTLDPLAAGVLPILLGEATKLSTYLLHDSRKIYRGRLCLGVTTDSWDVEGTVVAEAPWDHVREEDVAKAIASWVHLTVQEIPAYSAAKFQGQPLYKLARKGQHVPRKMKEIKVFSAGMLNDSLPYVSFRVACASGAYIRSLAHSLGQRLGCGAALCALTRESSYPFDLSSAVALDELRHGLRSDHILPMMAAAPQWPRVALDSAAYAGVRNGVAVPATAGVTGRAFLCYDATPVAVGRAEVVAGRCCYVVERGLWNV